MSEYTSISEQVGNLVQDALERVTTENVQWDVSMTVVPGPTGPQPILVLTLVIAALVVGDHHSGCVMLQPAIPRQEQMDDLVRSLVNGLLDARQATKVQANGHSQGGPSSLILPGQG